MQEQMITTTVEKTKKPKVRRKKEIPTWMWVISLLLLIVYVWCIGSDVLALLAWLFFSLLSKVISLF